MGVVTEKGIVMKTIGSMAWVQTHKSSACEGCSSRHSCNPSHQGTQDMEVEVDNPVNAKKGDSVVIALETSSFVKLSFLLYIFPILCLMGGALLGEALGPWNGISAGNLSIITGFLGFFLAFGLVRFAGSRLAGKSKYRPRILRVC